jgi:hypothetical protein
VQARRHLRDLDLQTSRLAGEVHDVLASIDEYLEEQASRLAQPGRRGALGRRPLDRGPRAAAEAAAHRAVRGRAALARLRREGGAERDRAPARARGHRPAARQLLAGDDGGAELLRARRRSRIRALVAGEPDASPRDLHLAAEVDRAVEEEVSRRESSVRTGILNAIAQGAGAVLDALARSSARVRARDGRPLTGRTQANVQGVVNVGFGVGSQRCRRGEIVAQPAGEGSGGGTRSGLRDADGNAVELVAKIYSAVMDLGTCDECAKWDGAEFPIDYPEDYTGVQCPNPRCSGGYSRCRCVWIYITSRANPQCRWCVSALDPAAE